MSEEKYDALVAEWNGLKSDLETLEATTSVFGVALIRVRMTEIEFDLADADNHAFQQVISEFEQE